jgi:hypothetical protein
MAIYSIILSQSIDSSGISPYLCNTTFLTTVWFVLVSFIKYISEANWLRSYLSVPEVKALSVRVLINWPMEL